MATVSSPSPTLWPTPAAPAWTRAATPLLAPAPCALGFGFFVLLNAILFIRPSEFVPAIYGVELYLYAMLLCLACSFPVLIGILDLSRLQRSPITVCVIGFLFAIIFSNLANLQLAESGAGENGVLFLKILLYYLLFVGLVTTPHRLRILFWWLPIFCIVVASLSVLQYHNLIELTGKWSVQDQGWDMLESRRVPIIRVMGTGLFSDPNEFCVLMTLAIILCSYWVTERRLGVYSMLWLLPIPLLYYALTLTQSRGGFLALLAGLVVFFRARFGWSMTLILGCVVLPALAAVVGGRMGSLSSSAGTAQERMGLWADAMMELQRAPIFGVGCMTFVQKAGLAAHNSYLHAFAELGVVGGVLFLGAFGFGMVRLMRLTTGGRQIADPELRRMLPFVTALLASYMVGMFTLSLNYVMPTFTILAVVTAYLEMTRSDPPLPEARFGAPWLLTWAGVSLVYLVCQSLMLKVLLSR
jgi:putative inorganic carbon (hco3(-)) transporter